LKKIPFFKKKERKKVYFKGEVLLPNELKKGLSGAGEGFGFTALGRGFQKD